jgi:hypothetical protein
MIGVGVIIACLLVFNAVLVLRVHGVVRDLRRSMDMSTGLMLAWVETWPDDAVRRRLQGVVASFGTRHT